MSTDLNMIQAQIALGFAMEDFKASDVGRYFAARAQETMLDGLDALKVADAFDGRAIARIQQRIATAEQFFVWMSEAIDMGASAKAAFEEITQTPADSA